MARTKKKLDFKIKSGASSSRKIEKKASLKKNDSISIEDESLDENFEFATNKQKDQ